MSELKYVGKSFKRKDGPDKVTGKAVYTQDVKLPNTLIGRVLRSPHAHAFILDVQTERARAVPGVVAVLTADDVPGTNALSFFRPDQPVLAFGTVRHEGEAVALVVAETPEAALAGRASVEVRYEVLPAMLTPGQALGPGAIPVHDGVANECFVMRLEQDRADEAEFSGKKYAFMLDKPYRWESWAAPKGRDGALDHNKAQTGDDLHDFVDKKLFPYLRGFKQKASGPDTIEYKVGEIFSEIQNNIRSGYNLREIIDHIDELRFRSQNGA